METLALENGCPWDQSTCSAAAQGGHLRLLHWAITNGCPWNPKKCRTAARDRPDVVQWITWAIVSSL